MNIKRILVVVGFILAIIILAWALYYFIFRSLISPTPPINSNTNTGTLPNINQGGPTVGNVNTNTNTNLPDILGTGKQPDKVAIGGPTEVQDYGVVNVADPGTAGKDIFFYNDLASTFMTLNNDGTATPINSQLFYNVDKVTWSSGMDKAIIEYPDGSNILYDFKTSKQITLPRELEKFAINSTGTMLSAIWESGNPDNNWLMVGNIDGSNLKIVEPVADKKNDVQVAVSPDNQVVALYRQAVDTGKQEVFPVGQNNENFNSFIVDGLKFESKWSPGGKNLLYNVSSPKDRYQPRLWLTEGQTDSLGYSQTNLELNTWADKCTFNSNGSSLYCAVPTSLPEGAGLFPELAKGVPDVFYRIDLVSGLKIPLAIPVGQKTEYSAGSLFLSADQSLLYFVDNDTNRLHSIRLK